MKVALFTDCYFPNIGGAEIVVHKLANSFCVNGLDTYVIAPYKRGVLSKKIDYKLKTYPHIPGKLIWLRFLVQMTFVLIYQNKYKFDVIHIHKTYSGFPISFLKKFISAKIVITAHGGDIQKDLQLKYGRRIEEPVWEKRIQKAITSADHLIAISTETKKHFIDLGALESNITLIANGADIERFNEKAPPLSNFLEIPKDKKIILAVGRYHIKKGYEYLIKAAAKIKDEYPNFVIFIVGKDLNKLDDLIKESGLTDNVRLISQQGTSDTEKVILPNDFLLSLYQNSDIFACTSIIEGFSLVCIEALSAGLPMILTSCPGNEDLFEGNDLGCLYAQTGNIEEISNNLLSLLQDEDRAKRYKEYNFQLSRDKYSWDYIAKEHINLFKSLITS